MTGTISIARRANDDIAIRIDDSASGVVIVEVLVKPHDLAMALTGRYSPVEISFAPNHAVVDSIGKP